MEDNTEFIFVGGEGDEPPEEVKELLRKLISEKLLGEPPAREVTADVVNPNREQYNLGPGDHCIVILGQDEEPRVEGDNSYTLFQVLDPEEYADEFPDWEVRLKNSYLLGYRYDQEEELGDLGWVARVNLMKVEEWQWDEVQAHNSGQQTLEMPCAWLNCVYGYTIEGLRVANPDLEMPSPIFCGECGQPTVMLKMRQVSESFGIAGTYPVSRQGKKASDFYLLSEGAGRDIGTAELCCIACEATVEVDLDQHDVFFNRR